MYIHLNDLFVNYPATHAPAFGGGETITPGVYSIGGAGSIGGALTLNGGGNPNAFFIIKFYGAMTVGAGATINLIGGTKSSNVFFIADGAISVAANTNIKGTLFAKKGAVGLGADAILEGRMLTLEGALVAGANATVSRPADACTIPIFCETGCSPAPAVDVLGVLSNYALYTNVGAVPNTSTSGIDGNIGTNAGAISGFESSVVVGSYHTVDASTAQANIDLDKAYNSLMALPNTVPSSAGVSPVVLAHAPAFGSVAAGGETINAGVYFINGAGSMAGTLVLDGQNNPNAIFVFKFAGAFSVGAQAKMILINGARRCNVFFIGGAGVATGAISIGAGSVLKGTFLSHNGACGSGASVFLNGRQLSTGGAVVVYGGVIFNNPVCVTSTSLNAPKIVAVTESPSVLPGTSTASVIGNDTVNGVQAVIGTAPGQVTLTSTPNGPLTMNVATGTIAVAANTPAGSYPITYKICEVSNPANCSTVTSNVTVTAPVIAAVTETTLAINGNIGGSTTSLTTNDTLNGLAVTIGTAPGNVKMTTGTLPAGITVNTATGIVTVATNTPAGSYPISYTICEINNSSNCTTATATITVTAPASAPTAITGATIICNGTSTTLTATGGTMTATSSYQWGTGSTVGSNIISEQITASITVSPTSNIVYWVRRVDTANNNITGGVSQTVSIISSVGGTLSANQNICAGASASDIILTGNIGNVVKWQKSNDATFATFTDIANASKTLLSSAIGLLNATTYYRVVLANGSCSSALSTTLGIIVAPASVGGTISGSTKICSGSNATLLLGGKVGSVIK